MLLKIVLIGATQVGKTQIFNRFCSSKAFSTVYTPSQQPDFSGTKVRLRTGADVILQVWDIPGGSLLNKKKGQYVVDAHCCVLVADLLSKASLLALDSILREFRKLNESNMDTCAVVLLVNKAELGNKGKQELFPEDIELFCEKCAVDLFMETSAALETNISSALMKVTELAVLNSLKRKGLMVELPTRNSPEPVEEPAPPPPPEPTSETPPPPEMAPPSSDADFSLSSDMSAQSQYPSVHWGERDTAAISKFLSSRAPVGVSELGELLTKLRQPHLASIRDRVFAAFDVRHKGDLSPQDVLQGLELLIWGDIATRAAVVFRMLDYAAWPCRDMRFRVGRQPVSKARHQRDSVLFELYHVDESEGSFVTRDEVTQVLFKLIGTDEVKKQLEQFDTTEDDLQQALESALGETAASLFEVLGHAEKYTITEADFVAGVRSAPHVLRPFEVNVAALCAVPGRRASMDGCGGDIGHGEGKSESGDQVPIGLDNRGGMSDSTITDVVGAIDNKEEGRGRNGPGASANKGTKAHSEGEKGNITGSGKDVHVGVNRKADKRNSVHTGHNRPMK